MTSLASYRDERTWRHNEDVIVVLKGLSEQTEYSHLYCYAEDDEDDGPYLTCLWGTRARDILP